MLTKSLLSAQRADRDIWLAGAANDSFASHFERHDRTIGQARLRVIQRQDVSIEDRLNEAVAKFKRSASQFAMHVNDELRRRVIAQFTMLLNPEDWDEEDSLPSEQSEQAFFRALAYLKPAVRPSLGLSGSNILGMWSNPSNSLTIEFQGSDRVRWFIRSVREGETSTASGASNAASLPNILEGFGMTGVLHGQE